MKTTFLVSSIILIFYCQLNLVAGTGDNPTGKGPPIVKAMAVAPGFADSQIAMAVYTIK
jgi:hypothetical protein